MLNRSFLWIQKSCTPSLSLSQEYALYMCMCVWVCLFVLPSSVFQEMLVLRKATRLPLWLGKWQSILLKLLTYSPSKLFHNLWRHCAQDSCLLVAAVTSTHFFLQSFASTGLVTGTSDLVPTLDLYRSSRMGVGWWWSNVNPATAHDRGFTEIT